MNNWEPINKEELEALVDEQLNECTPEQKEIFKKYRVPLKQHFLERNGNKEKVFVVAVKNNEALYYEDVEEGFNFSPLNPDGSIKEHWSNQDELKIALSHWQ